jgi:hypothetical protein
MNSQLIDLDDALPVKPCSTSTRPTATTAASPRSACPSPSNSAKSTNWTASSSAASRCRRASTCIAKATVFSRLRRALRDAEGLPDHRRRPRAGHGFLLPRRNPGHGRHQQQHPRLVGQGPGNRGSMRDSLQFAGKAERQHAAPAAAFLPAHEPGDRRGPATDHPAVEEFGRRAGRRPGAQRIDAQCDGACPPRSSASACRAWISAITSDSPSRPSAASSAACRSWILHVENKEIEILDIDALERWRICIPVSLITRTSAQVAPQILPDRCTPGGESFRARETAAQSLASLPTLSTPRAGLLTQVNSA